MATCPECEFDEIDTEDFEEGDSLSCPECGKSLVLVGADELDVAGDDDEDVEEEEEDAEGDLDEEDEAEDEEDFDE
jgi:alpha-aminoadipate/glutamate carrier protein LysW